MEHDTQQKEGLVICKTITRTSKKKHPLICTLNRLHFTSPSFTVLHPIIQQFKTITSRDQSTISRAKNIELYTPQTQQYLTLQLVSMESMDNVCTLWGQVIFGAYKM